MRAISGIGLHLLGRFAVFPARAPDQPLSISSRKGRALLAYVSMQPEPTLTREQLATLLWGDRFDPQARQSLRQCLLALRKQLESVAPGLLFLDGDLVGLKAPLFSTDAHEFAALADEAANLERALVLYRGEFLAGFSLDVEPFDEWVRGERARLAAIAARLLELQAQQSDECGHGEQALRACERLLAIDPLREDWQRLALKLTARHRGRDPAMARANALLALLRGELDADPEPATVTLIADIKRGSIAPAPQMHRPKPMMLARRDADSAYTAAPLAPKPAADAPPGAEATFEPAPATDWRTTILHAWPLAVLACVAGLAIIVSRLWLLAPNHSVSASADHQTFSLAESRAVTVAKLPGRIFKDCDICPEMVELPVGEFVMGSPQDERGREQTEGPQRRVVIAKRIALGRFEVTVDQLAAFVAETGFNVGNECDALDPNTASLRARDRSFGQHGFEFAGSHPAVCVNWHEAQAYVTWLGRRTGTPYRLPSEAEWEYAARAGTTTSYSFGNDETQLCHYGRFADLASQFRWRGGCRSAMTTHGPIQVGALKPNAWGLFDMHGNVWEWVADCWTPDAREIPTDGSAFTRPDHCEVGVIRGGGWPTGYARLRSAQRLPWTAASRYYALGLRVALSLEPATVRRSPSPRAAGVE
jgi:formylglycine-generating enzyme required for sulfatase activity/DNA-binding SARP family transcriptional activator